MLDRLTFFLTASRAEERQQGNALAVGAGAEQGFIGGERRSGHRARRPDGLGQVRPLKLLADAFEREKVEGLVLDHRPADGSAGLLAAKVLERFVVRCVRCEALDALVVKQRSLHLIRSGLGDDVDDAASGVAELGAGASRDHLELPHRLERDVDGRTLAAHLFAEEAVGVITTVEADVVEYAALSGKRDLVAVGSLHDAHARSERQEILELAAEDRRGSNRRLVERGCSGGARRVHSRRLRRHGHRLGDAGRLHRRSESHRLANGDENVFLYQRGESGQFERHCVATRRQLERDEPSGTIGRQRACEVCVDVADLDIHAGEHSAARIEDRAVDDAGRDLRLGRGCGRHCQTKDRSREQMLRPHH